MGVRRGKTRARRVVRKLLELLTTTSFGPLLINGDAGGTITAEGVSHLCQKQDINTLIHLGNTGINADCLLTTTTCKIPSGPLIAPCSQGAVERKRGGVMGRCLRHAGRAKLGGRKTKRRLVGFHSSGNVQDAEL